MKVILKYLRGSMKHMILLMALYLVQAVTSLLLPFTMTKIVNDGIANLDMRYVYIYSAVMLLLALINLACALGANKVTSVMVPRVICNMRNDVFNKVNSLSFEQFSEIGTGSLITRVTDDIGWLEEVISFLPYVFIMVPVLFLGGVILTAIGDWVLALILLAVSPIILILMALITKGMAKRWDRAQEYSDIQNKIIRERLSGIRVIRAFNKDSFEHQRAKEATKVMSKNFVKNNTISGLINPLTVFLLNLVTVAIIYVGAIRLQNDPMLEGGNILGAIQYIALIGNAIFLLAWTVAFMPHVKVSMRRVSEVMDLEIAEEQKSSGEKLSGSLEFNNVNFAYPKAQKNALENINFKVAEGEIVGIIGGTGSGKTTLTKLIMNFYSDVEGECLVGGKNYNDFAPATIRDNIAIALQKSMIFEGTVLENIKMGNKDATLEEVNKVVEIAQLEDFLKDHEEGLEYKLNQSGSNLSGGQKQRINIARAILKPANIYIFDDSFSALDFLTEKNLRLALNKHLEGKTQLIITQRAATAMRCDKVFVMDRGEIVGFGTHKELLKSCGVYKEIYDSQLGGDKNGTN